MEHQRLEYRILFPHDKCGREFEMKMVEFPPKVMICPGCGDVLKLTYVNEATGATNYINCGRH